MPNVEKKREQAEDLYPEAWWVAFGHDAALVAARDAASGYVGTYGDADIEELSDRDRRLLAIGTLAGAARAVASVRFPFENSQESLERTDFLLEYAASVGCRDDKLMPLFEQGKKAAA